MPKKSDIAIGHRAYEEILRLFETYKAAAQAIGCDRKMFNNWRCGTAPGAWMLARLHIVGADVIYILTGRRSK